MNNHIREYYIFKSIELKKKFHKITNFKMVLSSQINTHNCFFFRYCNNKKQVQIVQYKNCNITDINILAGYDNRFIYFQSIYEILNNRKYIDNFKIKITPERINKYFKNGLMILNIDIFISKIYFLRLMKEPISSKLINLFKYQNLIFKIESEILIRSFSITSKTKSSILKNGYLLDYQLKNIKWMQDLENKIENHKLKIANINLNNDDFFVNINNKLYVYKNDINILNKSFSNCKKTDIFLNGGILADDTGLGKSMSILGLIISNNHSSNLIICPRHLCEQWEYYIKKFTRLSLKTIFSKFCLQKCDTKIFESYDIILIHYNILKSKNNPIIDFYWNRVVLDEYQSIINQNTLKKNNLYEIINGIKKNKVWLLSNNPFDNINDFWMSINTISLTKFTNQNLHLANLLKKKIIRRNIYCTDTYTDTVETKIILDQTEQEKKIYNSVKDNLSKMISYCSYIPSYLLQENYLQFKTSPIKKLKININKKLQYIDFNNELCPICFDNLDTNSRTTIFKCGHFFCLSCTNKIMNNNKCICPLCRLDISKNEIKLINNNKICQDTFQYGSKISFLMEYLKNQLISNKEKILIVVKREKSLDCVSSSFKKKRINYSILRGGQKIIPDILTNSRIFIVSSEFVVEGLKIDSIDQIILLNILSIDYQKNKILEKKMISCCINPIEKKKKLKIIRLIMKDTIEQDFFFIK